MGVPNLRAIRDWCLDKFQPKGDYTTNEECTRKFQPKGEYITNEELEKVAGAFASQQIYGIVECKTKADEQVKVIEINGFELKDGATIRVRFIFGNTIIAPKLNVNNSGAKDMVYYKEAAGGYSTLNPDMLKSGYVYTFIYMKLGEQDFWYLDANPSAVKELNDKFGGMTFGIDENGNYGYIKAGADTVTPFKSTGSSGGSPLTHSCDLFFISAMRDSMSYKVDFYKNNPKKLIIKKLEGCSYNNQYSSRNIYSYLRIYGTKKGDTATSLIYEKSMKTSNGTLVVFSENEEIDLSEYESLDYCYFMKQVVSNDTSETRHRCKVEFEIYL